MSLQLWLKTATQGLESSLAARVRDELTSHYEDAIEAYLDAGMGEDQARQQALADLGNPGDTGNGLNDTHKGQAQYWGGLIASILMLLALLVFPYFHDLLGFTYDTFASQLYITGTELTFFSLTVYVLLILVRLLTWRFNLQVRTVSRFLIIMMVFNQSMVVQRRFLYGYDAFEDATLALHTLSGMDEVILGVLSHLSRFVLGLSILLFAIQLTQVRTGLYGMRWPLIATLMLMSVSLTATPLLVNFGSTASTHLIYFMAVLGQVLLWGVLVVLFLRATMRPWTPPQQIA